MPIRRAELVSLSGIAGHLFLYAASVVLIATYYNDRHFFDWAQPIPWKLLLSDIPHLSQSDFARALNVPATIIFCCSCSLSLLSVIIQERLAPWLVRLFFFAQGLLFLVAGGWVGVLSLFFYVIDLAPPDGEWLGEHRPILQVFGLWGVFSIFLAWWLPRSVGPKGRAA